MNIEKAIQIADNCRYCLMCRHIAPLEFITHRETLSPHGISFHYANVKNNRSYSWAEVEGIYKTTVSRKKPRRQSTAYVTPNRHGFWFAVRTNADTKCEKSILIRDFDRFYLLALYLWKSYAMNNFIRFFSQVFKEGDHPSCHRDNIPECKYGQCITFE